MALTADQVQKFYIGYYARPADPVGLTYWQTQDEAAALKGFSESTEFTNQFTGLSASQQVTQVYNNLLGRAPDTAGLLYWAGELTAGRESIGTLVLSMTKNALGKDVTTIEDRVSYSKSFTAALDTAAEINAYAGAAATQTARTALLKVVANSVGDHTALNAEVKNIDATVATIVSGGSGGGTPGQAFTLTDKIGESVVGTTGNDTFKAVLGATGAASDSTLNLGDSIEGGAGTDTLNLIMTGTNAAFPGGVTVKDVEIVNIDVSGAAAPANAATLKASNFAGVKELWQIDNVAAGGTFANVTVASGVVAGFASTGNKATAQVATANADFGGTATAGTIALNGVADTSAVTFVGAKLETITVNGSVTQNSATTANTLTVVTAGQETALNLGLTSATTVTVTGTSTTLKSVDTSAGTGNITADLTALTKLVSFKGGAANEKITLDVEGAASAKATTVHLGAGNDTLTLNGTAATANIEGTKITLGAGKDTLVTTALGNIFDATEANFAKGIIEVTDFATADDVLNLNGNGLALDTAQLDTIKGQGSLFAAVNEAAKLTGAAGATKTSVAFSYGADTYVLVDADNNGFETGDGLLKLTGVSAYDLTNVQNGNLVL